MKKQYSRSFLSKAKFFWSPLIGLLLIAFGLRVFRLDAQSLWWDEGISLHLATSSLAEIFADRINNIHPPLYFFILKIWLHLTGVNPFSARYLSALASWLQVALLFAVLRRWYGGSLRGLSTAWVGGVLLAFSAVAIIYGQETRVYAFLPLIFLALLALTQRILELENRPSHANWRLYFGLGVVVWIGLHLHYIVAFMVVYVTLWAAIVLIRKRFWGGLWRWVATYILVGLASLPWFGMLLWNWTAVQAEANAGTFSTEPVPFDFLIQQVWVFHLTGLAGSLAEPLVRWLAGATAVVFLILLAIRLTQKPTRSTTATLLAHWVIPLSSALLVWRVRSFSHPRYVVMYTVGLTLLAAYLIWPQNSRRPKRFEGAKMPAWVRVLYGLLVAGLLVTSGWGLYHYYFDPGTAKDDVRAAAHYLEETAVAGDLILLPDTDYSLQFEYDGGVTVAMPTVDQPDQMWPHLTALTTDVEHVFVLDYKRGTRDWQQIVPFVLENAGTLVDETVIDALIVREYLLDTAVIPTVFDSQQTRFGPLLLTDSWLEQDVPSNSAVTLALRWSLVEPVKDQLNLAMRLRDDSGWVVATEDDLLLDGNGRPTDQWGAETVVVTYHVLPLKAGMPLTNYDLNVSIYSTEDGVNTLDVLDNLGASQGQDFLIGSIMLDNPLPAANGLRDLLVEPYAEPLILLPELKLLGAHIEASELLAGQKAWVQLMWQIPENVNALTEPNLLLLQGEEMVATDLGQAHFPVEIGLPGEPYAQRRSLRLPADVVGDLTVALQVGDIIQPIGNINVTATEREFVQPDVAFPADVEFGGITRFVGYDLIQDTGVPHESVSLVLYWEALADGVTDYTVFTHLLAADGQLIGQHDAQPVQGTRPTSTWLQGEFIADPHMITLREEEFQGKAQIEVGIYNPETGERLLTTDGADFILLPEIVLFDGG